GGCSGECGSNSNQRGVMGSGNKNQRPLKAALSQIILDELPYFASAFSNQRNDIDIRRCIFCDHAEQRALANAAATENSDTLAHAAGEQPIDGSNASLNCFANGIAIHGIRRLRIEFLLYEIQGKRFAVERPSES